MRPRFSEKAGWGEHEKAESRLDWIGKTSTTKHDNNYSIALLQQEQSTLVEQPALYLDVITILLGKVPFHHALFRTSYARILNLSRRAKGIQTRGWLFERGEDLTRGRGTQRVRSSLLVGG